jgi:hypothetical protein
VSTLNHIAQAAAALLLIELIVLLLIFVAVAGGLAFGLRWARGKTGWAFEKGNGYILMGARYLDKGTDYAAKPFIVSSSFVERIKATFRTIRDEVRALQARRAETTTEVAAVPVAPQREEEPEAPVPLV